MLLCIFIIGLVSAMVLGMLKALTTRHQVAETIQQNEQHYYAAEAGIQHAIAEVHSSPGFTGTIDWDTSKTKLPIEVLPFRYSVSVITQPDGATLITSNGSANGHTTTLVKTMSGKVTP